MHAHSFSIPPPPPPPPLEFNYLPLFLKINTNISSHYCFIVCFTV